MGHQRLHLHRGKHYPDYIRSTVSLSVLALCIIAEVALGLGRYVILARVEHPQTWEVPLRRDTQDTDMVMMVTMTTRREEKKARVGLLAVKGGEWLFVSFYAVSIG